MNEEIGKNILKSGTSIVGIVCKDGVVMAADRRSTAGNIVMSKDSQKIRKIGNYLATAYTGGVADIQLTNKLLTAELRLKELKTKSQPSVEEAAHLLAMLVYRGIRTPAMIPSIVGTLIAGVDPDGKTSLYTVEPAGGVNQVDDYDANFSSGMPYILGLLERGYKKDLSVEEGIELGRECIKASMQRDTGSGNGIDIFSITKAGVKQVISEELIPQYR